MESELGGKNCFQFVEDTKTKNKILFYIYI